MWSARMRRGSRFELRGSRVKRRTVRPSDREVSLYEDEGGGGEASGAPRPTSASSQRAARSPPPPMHLLVVRHAIAEDKDVFARTGRSDDLRPLTDDGRAKMRRAADGLRSVAPEVDLVATSPLV